MIKIGLVLYGLFTAAMAANSEEKPICNLEMFGGADKGKEAVTACEAIDVL
jgi:hypothetical protein